MINISFTFRPAKYVRNNIQGEQLTDLDYDGTTIRKSIRNWSGVNRLNKNLCMSTF